MGQTYTGLYAILILNLKRDLLLQGIIGFPLVFYLQIGAFKALVLGFDFEKIKIGR